MPAARLCITCASQASLSRHLRGHRSRTGGRSSSPAWSWRSSCTRSATASSRSGSVTTPPSAPVASPSTRSRTSTRSARSSCRRWARCSGFPVLAWAKPVPVNPNRMRNPRRNMLFVEPRRARSRTSLLMGVAALAARRSTTRARCRSTSDSTTCPLGIQILFSFALVNLFLGLFNLLPIPPLDGSALIERVLPGEVAAELVPVPSVRVPRAVHPRVHHRLRGAHPRPFVGRAGRFVFG